MLVKRVPPKLALLNEKRLRCRFITVSRDVSFLFSLLFLLSFSQRQVNPATRDFDGSGENREPRPGHGGL